MEKHDVLIVGAGPAGLKAAQVLVEHGKDVLVLEKLPEEKLGEKICHGMLPLHTMTILNIPQELTDVPLNGAVIYFADKSYASVEFKPPLCQMWLRKNFGKWLVEETRKKGVMIRPNSRVISLKKDENYVGLENGDKIGYDYLIGADGSKSVIRKSLGLKTKSALATYTEVPISPDKMPNGRKDFGHFYASFDLHAHGYAGYTPYKDRVSFCLVSIDTKFFSNLEKVKRFNRFVSEVEGINPEDYELKAQTCCYKPVGLKHDNIYLVGDAGGWGTIVCGEIYSAAKTGKIAAEDLCGINISKEYKEYMKWRKFWDKISFKVAKRKKKQKSKTKYLFDSLLPRLIKHKFLFSFFYRRYWKKLFAPLPSDKDKMK
jgi:flavin-dependent dehydrogenase